MSTFRPKNFMLLPTMACQAQCSYCFARKNGETMSDEVADAALDFIARTAPEGEDFQLTFHGGEPMLARPGFYERILPIIQQRFGLRAHLAIQSNLWALDDRMLTLIKKYRIGVGTSLDGFEEMCDAQRGKGYFANTRASESILRANGITAGEICTFAASHAHCAAEVFRKSERPYSIHGAVASYGMPADSNTVSAEQMEQILTDSYEAYKADQAHNRISTIDAMVKGCFDGRGRTCSFFDCLGVFAAIAPDGSIYSCQRFCGCSEFCLGNVLDNPTEENILTSSAYRRLRVKEDGKREACGDCSHYEYCRGGCLYNALTADTSIDPYCEAYKHCFDKISMDMALEMGSVLLGESSPTPVLAMAGDMPHPHDKRINLNALRSALAHGRNGGYPEQVRFKEYPENHLNKLYLHVTFRCPLRCPHCYAEGGERITDEMRPDQLMNIISDAADNRFRSVVITGGEPLVYSGFDELLQGLESFDRKGMKLILRSSFAFPIEDKLLKRVCSVFDEIVISLDGNEQTHDARRGIGRYKQTVHNVEAAAKLGAASKLGLSCTLSKEENEGEPGKAVSALARRLKIQKVLFRPVLPLGRGSDAQYESMALCSEELELPEKFHPRFNCGLGQNLYVEPDGSTYPCYAWCAPDKKLGDLRRGCLGDILSSGELFEYCRHDVDSNEKCRSCEVRYLCGGICRAWVKDRENIDSGDFDCTARKEYFTRIAQQISKED